MSKSTNVPIRRGQLVEFSDKYFFHWPPEDQSLVRYGICAQDGDLEALPLKVETDRGIEDVWHVHAYAWSGWVPDELLPLLDKYFPPGEEED